MNGVKLILVCLWAMWCTAVVAQPGEHIIESFTVQQIGAHVRADFGIRGGASCLGTELERSTDGGVTFTTVAAIREVCGGSSFTEFYSFNDLTPVPGVEAIYRLDLGGVGRTNDRRLTFVQLFDELVIYPNPAGENARMRWNRMASDRFELQIFALTGRMVYQTLGVGNTFVLTTSDLGKGRYQVIIITDAGVLKTPLVVH